ncbi:MAG: recombinase family protein [Ruminococcus sp.]|jgi:site-specific DNA recombinase
MRQRAVIYCRCSTEEERQKEALVHQEEEARAAAAQRGWVLVDTYVESASGTSRKGRREYNRLYEDLLYDIFDIIVIKSQDRLMRNTKDWYLFIDRLTCTGKRLYMYLDQIFYSPDDSLITGIKAILAEDYSRELSKKINNAHRNRQKNGGAVILTSQAYGFRRNPDHSIELQEEEAAIKRRMYELCAAGYGGRAIASIMKAEGVCNRKGNFFSAADILRMIKNPLNKGTAVMNRRHYDFERKRTVPVPREEQYIHEHKVLPTVSETLWEEANQKIKERTKGKEGKESRGRNRGRHPLSGRIFCGLCGAPYYRRVRTKGKSKEKIYEWKCSNYLENGRPSFESSDGCSNIHIRENQLVDLLGQTYGDRQESEKEQMVKKTITLIKEAVRGKESQAEILQFRQTLGEISRQREMLLDKLLKGVLTDEIYQKKEGRLKEEAKTLEERIEFLENRERMENKEKGREKEIETYLKENKVVEKAMAAVMMERSERLEIFPDRIEVVSGHKQQKIMYGEVFDYYAKKRKERQQMADYIHQNPDITARELAEYFGLTLSGVNYRLRVLRKENRLHSKS